MHSLSLSPMTITIFFKWESSDPLKIKPCLFGDLTLQMEKGRKRKRRQSLSLLSKRSCQMSPQVRGETSKREEKIPFSVTVEGDFIHKALV